MNNNSWAECSKEEYNYRDRINYMYTVSEDTNKITYYRQVNMKIYDVEWLRNKLKKGEE